jgi:hypothetical protein
LWELEDEMLENFEDIKYAEIKKE